MAAPKRKKRADAKTASEYKVLPQSVEAEQSLLGAIFLDESALSRVLETRLSPEDFSTEGHQLIFATMRERFNRGQPVDLITVAEGLKGKEGWENAGGPAYLSELADAVGTAANVEHYARIVKDHAVLRRLITASSEIVENCYSPGQDVADVLDQAETLIYNIRSGQDQTAVQPVSTLVKDTISNLEVAMTRSGGLTGVATGYRDLDELTGGFQRSDLIILAGRPSMGKTALALNIAMQSAMAEERDQREGDPFPVAFFSLEMSKEQVLVRLLCSLSDMDLRDVRTGRIKADSFHNLITAASKLSSAPIFVDDTPAISVLEMRAKTRRLQNRLRQQGQELGLVMVDYLQLMRAQADSREQEISEISRSLKALAKELNVPVLALSQLNRRVEERPDKRPQLADLRESGAIEQDADVIAFVYRGEYYKPDNPELRGQAELLLRKQRNGPTGDVRLAFLHHSARFRSAARRDEVVYA